jgi:hypothetical protein
MTISLWGMNTWIVHDLHARNFQVKSFRFLDRVHMVKHQREIGEPFLHICRFFVIPPMAHRLHPLTTDHPLGDAWCPISHFLLFNKEA